jgi:hypothetical protein
VFVAERKGEGVKRALVFLIGGPVTLVVAHVILMVSGETSELVFVTENVKGPSPLSSLRVTGKM